PTVKLIDTALRNLRESPLMVLALARPEVKEEFGAPWAGRAVHEIRLDGLTRKASERLVREALGGVSDENVRFVVDRAEGNPFYVEEGLGAVVGGTSEALPDTVLGMVQARLDAIGPEAKRALRGASVFGATFWGGGLSVVLGGEGPARRRRDTGSASLAVVL